MTGVTGQTSNQIASLWFDGPLRPLDRVCVASMLAQGMAVTLFTYGDIPNAPPGAVVADGAEILDRSLIDRLVPIAKKDQACWLPTVQFSDFFRVFMLKAGRGLWLDTDVLLFRPFMYDPTVPFFARDGRATIGASVFYLPPTSAIIAEYDRLLESDDLKPDWLGFRRGLLRPMMYRLAGKPFSTSDLGITLYGNDAFTRLTHRHGIYDQALGKCSFYNWTGDAANQIYAPVPWRFYLEDTKYVGLHLHRKAPSALPAVAGSLWAWAQERYG